MFNTFYNNPIEGLNERIRKKLLALFMARWQYYHVPMFTAAYRFTPKYMRAYIDNRERGDKTEEKETKEFFKKFFPNPGRDGLAIRGKCLQSGGAVMAIA